MSVLTTSWKAEFTGDGATTTFLCAFPLMQTEDLLVYVNDVLMRANRDYTLSGVVYTERHTVASGFSVVMATAPASGAEVYIRRKTPRENQTVLHGGDRFSLPVFENNYDRLVMIYQEIGGLILEGFQGPIPETVPRRDYEPQSSGFFPAKVIAGPTDGFYTLRAAIPSDLGWDTTALPVLTEQGAEINRRLDIAIGDTVLVLPVADTNGQDAWRFVANQACEDAGGDPPYSGDFFVIARCDNPDVDEVAWVRDDEFDVGDVFMLNGICYIVQSGAVTGIAPELVVRVADTTAYADCSTCEAAMPDPDAPDPPITANVFRKMANCLDDSTDEYSLPVEYFGVPTNHDLTKIYEIPDGCYYVSEEEESSPSNPLLPIHAGTVFDNCEECGCNPVAEIGHQCTNCDDSTPQQYQITVSGIIGCLCAELTGGTWSSVNASALNGTFTLNQSTDPGGRCQWEATIPNAVTHTVYDDSSCTTIDGVDTFDVEVFFVKTSGGNCFVILEGARKSRAGVYAGGGLSMVFFFKFQLSFSDGALELCSVVPVFEDFRMVNGFCGESSADSTNNSGVRAAYGGTATVVCL